MARAQRSCRTVSFGEKAELFRGGRVFVLGDIWRVWGLLDGKKRNDEWSFLLSLRACTEEAFVFPIEVGDAICIHFFGPYRIVGNLNTEGNLEFIGVSRGEKLIDTDGIVDLRVCGIFICCENRTGSGVAKVTGGDA